jgi:tetratricopeptide (TPR) repeat protein
LTNTLDTNELAEAYRLLLTNPAGSEALCRAVLARNYDRRAHLMLSAALRHQRKFAQARKTALNAVQAHPGLALAHFELGAALGGVKKYADGIAALRRAEELSNGAVPGLWRELGAQYWAKNDRAAAAKAYTRHIALQALDPWMHEAVQAVQRRDYAVAQKITADHLDIYPDDPLALGMIAEILLQAERYEEAEPLLREALERAPDYINARYGHAVALVHANRKREALQHIDRLLADDPDNLGYLAVKAVTLRRAGEFEAAAACDEHVLRLRPEDASVWANYGDMLRTLGRREECEAAYRRAILLRPDAADAYWGLANLKTLRFSADDIEAMRVQLARIDLGETERTLISMALGKALEDEGDYAASFAAYRDANALWARRFPFNAEDASAFVQRARALFTPAFFEERCGAGDPAPDPIFIVGMPRSGSTLVEQIVASHSAVEGTMELQEVFNLARRLGLQGPYPEMLRQLPTEAFAQLGAAYIEDTRLYRKSPRPFFIDKMPNNFEQIGLIHLMLPNAKIIDVRRNPMACCWSNYKQHWAAGQYFAYDLHSLGVYYRAYVELMAHFDAVLPGRVHRVIYEDLIADPEQQTRALLAACGLPFEEACLRFYETKRTVRTPSSEQVRQPISAARMEDWRRFEAWLEPLREALGPALTAYPAAPPLD